MAIPRDRPRKAPRLAAPVGFEVGSRMAMFGFGALGLLLTNCAHTVDPNMSARSHRLEAAREQAIAEYHAEQFDLYAVAHTTPRDSSGPAIEQRYADYNPTKWHLEEAARHLYHAQEHERAARALEAFEEAECRAFQPSTRAACPLLGPIRLVEEIEGGVRLRLAPDAPVQAVVAHVRCHLAYARTRAFEVPSCPLTLRDVEAVMSDDGKGIELTSHDRKITHELRRRARELLGERADDRH